MPKPWYVNEKKFFNRIINKENNFFLNLDKIENQYKVYSRYRLERVKLLLEEQIYNEKETNYSTILISSFLTLITLLITPLITFLLSLPGLAISILSLKIHKDSISAQEVDRYVSKLSDLLPELFKIIFEALGNDIYPWVFLLFLVILILILKYSYKKSVEL
ncbi:hypothetical protein [Desulforamulus ferrireducens]|uniref:hypothetical protein n=1 Tax=Desulforamulus ferrireducens TaxID=1833852 RepID=UPI0011EA5654|nr:hypothetical protein [Desulforamulus ferrireducens]